MDTYTVLIILSGLIIFSYVFDLIARRTRFPSVLLLLLSGIAMQYAAKYFELPVIDFYTILPALGTIGLILIVLEGALELKFDRRKIKLILKSFFSALFILLFTTGAIASIFHYITETDWYLSILNAIPYSIISSAIAIPSASTLSEDKKEFIIYESSMSDIMGIMLFNFVVLNQDFQPNSLLGLTRDTGLIILVSIIFSLLLLFIIGRIKHHVKFFLIIAIIILVYSAGHMFHLPSLIIVIGFGLFLNNADQVRYQPFRNIFLYQGFKEDLNQLFRLSSESAFLVRTFFFLIFGFIINLSLLYNPDMLMIGFFILIVIYVVRAIFLKFLGAGRLFPELFLSPRGLISILLYISIPAESRIGLANTGLLFLVILATSVIMSIGLLSARNKRVELEIVEQKEEEWPGELS